MTREDGQGSPTPATTRTNVRVVGADRDVDAIVAAIEEGRSLLVSGALGSGKTHLLDAVARAVGSFAEAPLFVRAAAPLATAPFGALRMNPGVAALLAVETVDERVGRGSAVNEDGSVGAHVVGRRSTILLIDDAHLLDPDSARWVVRAVYAGVVTLLATAAPSSSPEARRASPETLTELDDLWISGHVGRIDLRPLSAAESDEIIAEEVGHGIVDRIRRAELHRASDGSRLVLVEMVRRLRERADVERPDHDDGRAPITPRIGDVLRYQLGALSTRERVTLTLVSRLGGVSRDRLARVIDARAVDRLLTKRHLSVDPRVPGMLRASRIFSTLGETSGDAEVVEQLVDSLGDVLPPETVLSGEEATDLAMRWSFDNRLADAAERHGPAVVVRVLLVASAREINRHNARDALTFAKMAEAIEPTSDSFLAVSRALSALRRDGEAFATLESAVPLLRREDEAHRLFQWWSSLLLGLGRFDELDALCASALSWPACGPLVRGEIRATAPHVDLLFMRWDDVARRGQEIVEDTSCALTTRVRAAVETATAYGYRGEVGRAYHFLDIARRINTDPVTGDVVDEIAHVTTLSGEALLRFNLGSGVSDLLEEVDTFLARTTIREGGPALAFLAYVGAVADLFRGDLRAADVEYRAAVSRFTTTESTGWRSGIHGEHALVLALLGNTAAAEASLRQAEALDASRAPLTRHLYARARYVTAAQMGSPQARIHARELLDLSADSAALHVVNLYLVIAFGDGTPADRDDLRRVSTEIENPLGLMLERHLTARDERDPRKLEEVAVEYAGLGAYLLARQAQEDAVREHEHTGNALRLSQARKQLSAYGTLSRRARGSEAHSSAERLSDRERQVATLVADGLTNREIADRLFLSVRTVESHVYQARLKLGAPNRRALADVLPSA